MRGEPHPRLHSRQPGRLYRVEDFAEFVGQRMTCLITDAPARKNLVLSRRAVLEREKEEAREKCCRRSSRARSIEGAVRKSWISGPSSTSAGWTACCTSANWPGAVSTIRARSSRGTANPRADRENRPRDRQDQLPYRDMLENPWESAAAKYPPTAWSAAGDQAHGVRRLCRVGARHRGTRSHLRTFAQAGVAPSDIVHEGQELEVLVLSVDPEAQRISLSIRALRSRSRPGGEGGRRSGAAGRTRSRQA